MAKKESRVTITAKDIEENKKEVTLDVSGIGELTVEIRYTLNLHDMLQLVEDVVSSVVDGEANTYIPEIREFALQAGVIKAYTNIKLPQSADKQYDIISRTDLFKKVVQHIDFNQLGEVRNAVFDRIEHEVAMIESVLSSKVNEMVTEFAAILSNLDTVFDGVKNTDVNNFVKQLSQIGSMTEESIAKAVMDIQRQEIGKQEDDVTVISPFTKKN